MDDENVLTLILSGESEQVERKEQLKNKKPEVARPSARSRTISRGPGAQVLSSSDSATMARPGVCPSRTRFSLNSPIDVAMTV